MTVPAVLLLSLAAALASAWPRPARADIRADAAAVQDCAQDLLPEEARGCFGRLAQSCFDGLEPWTLEQAAGCWRREEEAWAGWGRTTYAEAGARLETAAAGSAEGLAGSRRAWEAYRNAACGMQMRAWPADDNGPLLAARCRVWKQAERTPELFWLGLP